MYIIVDKATLHNLVWFLGGIAAATLYFIS